MTRSIALTAVLSALLTASLLVVPAPVAAADPVLVGAGDISDCGSAKDEETATLLDAIPGTVVTLGDNAYTSGSAAQYRDCYDPTWGRHKSRTKPSAGNHEYETSGATGYFGYFGAKAGPAGKGWYSYDLGSLAHDRAELELRRRRLRAELGPAHVAAGGPRRQRGRSRHRVLASPALQLGRARQRRLGPDRSGTPCTRPAPTSSSTATTTTTSASRRRTRAAAPTRPTGSGSSSSGRAGASCAPRDSTAANSQVFSETFGVLKLTLHANSYDWQFVPIAGESFTDTGTGTPARPGRDPIVQGDLGRLGRPAPSAREPRDVRAAVHRRRRRPRARPPQLREVQGHRPQRDRRSGGAAPVGDEPDPRTARRSPRPRTSWAGSTLTWRNRPGATGPVLADAGALAAGRWAEFDVTSAVHGNGTYAFLLRSTSADGLAASSLQGAHPPRLVVDPRLALARPGAVRHGVSCRSPPSRRSGTDPRQSCAHPPRREEPWTTSPYSSRPSPSGSLPPSSAA